MKLRNALAFLLVLFLAFPAFAEDCGCQKEPIELAMNVGMMAGSSTPAGGGATCSSGTLIFESVQSTVSQMTIHASNAYGSSFKTGAPGNINLYSIKLVGLYSNGNGETTMRYGNGANLGSYYDTVNVNTIDGTRTVEYVFADTVNVLDNSTTYYFGLIAPSGTITAAREAITTDSYVDGALYNTSTNWNMTGTSSTYDLRFEVYKCAD